MQFVRSVYHNLKILPASIFVIGLVSFLTDISSEMIYPLLPVFLTQILLATPTSLGLIEGVAEATSSVFKFVSGYFTDRTKNRKSFILIGYLISSLFRPLIAFAQIWPVVFLFRFIDRLGKGIRTSPRDALIADQVEHDQRGQAYGVHRAMDHAGAFVGPLVASLLMSFFGFTMREVFLSAAIPGLLSVLLIYWGIHEPKKNKSTLIPEKSFVSSTVSENIEINQLPVVDDVKKDNHIQAQLFFALVFIFTLANCADSFLLLRLSEVGVQTIWLPTIWSILNLIKMLSNLVGGYFSDRISSMKMLAFGWIYFAITYMMIGFFDNTVLVLCSFLLYGIHFGIIEPAERLVVAQMAKHSERGTLFGYFHMISGLGLLPASLMFGWIWDKYGSQVSFLFSSLLAFVAGFILFLFIQLTRSKLKAS